MLYDLAVIGCGGMGSSVLYHAAAQGANVLGIEQFSLVHDRGSSHGHTRIIRQAYFEHPDYVPLLLEAYRLWSEIEQVSQRRLYHEIGLLQVGPSDGVVVPGVLRSAAQHGLTVDSLDTRQAATRFPMFRLPDHHVAAFEKRAGYLLVEACVETYLKAARTHRAQLLDQTRLVDFEFRDDCIVLQTSRGVHRTKRVVFTVGAWISNWLKDAKINFQVLRKHLHWYHSPDTRTARDNGCPLFFFEDDHHGYYYGFPAIDERGVKVAEHSGGEVLAGPDDYDRGVDSDDRLRIEDFLRRYFHGQLEARDHATCMYTMTPDQDFVIDAHPVNDRIWIAAGFSGHGFKFASVVGKLVADASLANCNSFNCDPRLKFLSARRFV